MRPKGKKKETFAARATRRPKLAAVMTAVSIAAAAAAAPAAWATDAGSSGRDSGYEVLSDETAMDYDGVFHFAKTDLLDSFEDKAAKMKAAEDVMHESATCVISVEKEEFDGASVTIAHVLTAAPGQLRAVQSNDDLGGEREKPTQAAERTGAAIVVNGSYFSYETGAAMQAVAPVLIRDGVVAREGVSNGSEICVRFDGTLFSPHPGMGFTGADLVSMGVTSSLGTADPLLIQDGNLCSFPAGVATGSYPRTAIGMVAPCEYFFLVAGRNGYSGGLTYLQMQGLFHSLGCRFARSLDGGGSSAMAIDGELVTDPAVGGEERPVADFLCAFD